MAKSAQREREASFLKQKTGMNYKPEPSLLFKTLFHKYSEPQELLGREWKLTVFPSRVGILQLLSRVFYFTFLKEYFPQKEIYLHVNQSCLNYLNFHTWLYLL